MKVDILYTMHNKESTSWMQLLNSLRRHAVMAEEAGFDTLWLGEHHFDWGGSDLDPNPLLLFADLAVRTSKINFGTAALVLPLWHPIRLAEEIAMVDHLTGGRLSLGFVRGVIPNEVLNLNPTADRWRNPDASRAIFKEHLEIMRTAWTQESFSWKSERYTFPAPGIPRRQFVDPNPDTTKVVNLMEGAGFVDSMSLVPRTLQSPYPQLYSLTDTAKGYLEAAEIGLLPITWFPTGQKLMDLHELYRNKVASMTGQPVRSAGAGCGALRLAYVAPTEKAAREATEQMVNNFYRDIGKYRGPTMLLDEGEQPDDAKFENMSPWDILSEREQFFIGTPDTVIDKVISFSKKYGVERLLVEFGYGSISNDAAEPAVELWGKEVMPALVSAGIIH